MNYFVKLVLLLLAVSANIGAESVSKITENTYTLKTPPKLKIRATMSYQLNCETVYWSQFNIAGSIIKESQFKLREGHESSILSVENDKATFFGGDYLVLSDTEKQLIMLRRYIASGTSEMVSIDKDTGLGFDVKSQVISVSTAPSTTTYLLKCRLVR
jgi:hypothetical protein